MVEQPLQWSPSKKPRRSDVRPIEETGMSWKTPTVTEIALGAEINCYACATLK
jgi:coenzyme PQQ precursor peptide PqqA